MRELGSMSESEVCLSTMNFKEDKPPTGVRSLPVAKDKKAFLCSWVNSSRTSQSWTTMGVVGLNPPPYLAPFLSSPISIISDPQIIFSSSSGENN